MRLLRILMFVLFWAAGEARCWKNTATWPPVTRLLRKVTLSLFWMNRGPIPDGVRLMVLPLTTELTVLLKLMVLPGALRISLFWSVTLFWLVASVKLLWLEGVVTRFSSISAFVRPLVKKAAIVAAAPRSDQLRRTIVCAGPTAWIWKPVGKLYVMLL